MTTGMGPGPWQSTPGWHRLDPRMLLVQPALELGRYFPVLVGLIIAGSASGFGSWVAFGIALPVVLGVARYLTTEYRITDARIEIRSGLLQRRTTTAPLDRVRSVDLTATLAHRVLGLSTVVVGTGGAGQDDHLALDGLPTDQAAALRTALLHRREAAMPSMPAAPAGAADAAPSSPAPPPITPAPRVVARFEPAWLAYAPFTGTGLIAAGAVVGVGIQSADALDLHPHWERIDVPGFSVALVAGIGVAIVLLALVLTLVGYVVTNFGFTLARDSRAWHIRRGLVTTRETSVDVERVAGVTIGEPAAMRLARGGRLSAIVTGLRHSGESSAVLVPPAPWPTVRRVAAAVLGTPEPVDAPLQPHGPAAVRRRYSRALMGGALLIAAPVVLVAAGGPWWPLTLAPVLVAALLLLARDRAAGLGHAWVDGHVVMRSGSLARRRTALAGEHVIGWNLRASWFQRRAGLVTVAATTAGGSGATEVYDVPAADAERLAEQATPGLLAQFSA
ncbi:PH domain-containing protein [Nocardioides sp. YIM 152588]|uniref:PH domain-containing protein n=1 Tax=Nocardioides sp. YIM 152588 TaxID=3158259 RepID=UPI0032E4FBDD